MILINGESSDYIAVTDRGFQYGDGLFESIEVINGRPIFLQQHLCRLNTGCLKLKIPAPDAKQLIEEINFVCKNAKLAVLKIIITRGSGGRGYRQPDSLQPTRVISLHPFPEYPPTNAKQGIITRFCDVRLGLSPELAGIKHINRLEQVMARSEWDDPSIQEGIMLDINNHVIEGTMTNLFYIKDNVISTSPLKLSGVAGVMREILKKLITEKCLTLMECDYDKEKLLAADEAFVCNSIIGIWPIRQIEHMIFTAGSITTLLQAELEQYKKKELVNAR